MNIRFKFTNTFKVLRAISRLGNTGLKISTFVYWKVLRKYQENIYYKNAQNPSIEITTKIGCKNLCDFCPQDKLIKTYNTSLSNGNQMEKTYRKESILKLSSFKNFLTKIPKDYVVKFAGFSEPWLSSECTDMVLTAHEGGHKIGVFTTFVGMKPSDIKRLNKIPFEIFCIHLADETITKIRVDDNMKEVIKAVNKYGLHQMEIHNHYVEPHPELVKLFGRYSISTIDIVNRAENIVLADTKTKPERLKGKIRCGFNPNSNKLTWNVLLPNGDVTLCCEDYSLKHILGNLNDSDLLSLYNSESYKNIIRGLDDDSIDILCRYCHRAVHAN